LGDEYGIDAGTGIEHPIFASGVGWQDETRAAAKQIALLQNRPTGDGEPRMALFRPIPYANAHGMRAFYAVGMTQITSRSAGAASRTTKEKPWSFPPVTKLRSYQKHRGLPGTRLDW